MRNQLYTVEVWTGKEWEALYTAALSRAAAEMVMRQYSPGRRARLRNAKGKAVLYSGVVREEAK